MAECEGLWKSAANTNPASCILVAVEGDSGDEGSVQIALKRDADAEDGEEFGVGIIAVRIAVATASS